MIEDHTNVTTQDLEDMAFNLILATEAYLGKAMGTEVSGLEVAGGVHTIVATALLEIYKPHENELEEGPEDGSSTASIEGTADGPGQVSQLGTPGRIEEGQEGPREAEQGTQDGDREAKRDRES
jgi:hypothetical protein